MPMMLLSCQAVPGCATRQKPYEACCQCLYVVQAILALQPFGRGVFIWAFHVASHVLSGI